MKACVHARRSKRIFSYIIPGIHAKIEEERIWFFVPSGKAPNILNGGRLSCGYAYLNHMMSKARALFSADFFWCKRQLRKGPFFINY